MFHLLKCLPRHQRLKLGVAFSVALIFLSWIVFLRADPEEELEEVKPKIQTTTTSSPPQTPASGQQKFKKPCWINGSAWSAIGGDRNWSVIFVDHRPGKRRPIDIERLLPLAQIIVAHDTDADRYRWSKPTSRADPNPFAPRLTNLSIAHINAAMAGGGAPDAQRAFELAVNVWLAVELNETENASGEVLDLAKLVRAEMNRLDLQLNRADTLGFGTHRNFLLSAIVATKGAVLEMGVGDYSTHSLQRLVAEKGRYLESAETDLAWMNRFINMTSENHVFRHVPVYLRPSNDILNIDC